MQHYDQVRTEDYLKAAKWSLGTGTEISEKPDSVSAKERIDELLRQITEVAQNAAQSALESSDYNCLLGTEEAKLLGISRDVTSSQATTNKTSSPGGTRTPDQGIMSPLLSVDSAYKARGYLLVDRKKDSRLTEIIVAWNNLPDSAKRKILAVVMSSKSPIK